MFLGVGRYFRPREGSAARSLLLRLRAFKDCRGLQQDVRAAEICFAVVGGDVRETPDETSRGKSRRGAAAAKTLACRAAIEITFNLKSEVEPRFLHFVTANCAVLPAGMTALAY